MGSGRQACVRLAISQSGLVTLGQLPGVGWSRDALCKQAALGEWDLLLPGVYRMRGAPPSWHQSLRAACLWGGEGTAASHTSAGALHGLSGCSPGEVHIVTTKNPARLPVWVKAHRVPSAPPGIFPVLGIPVIPAWRLLIDLGSVLGKEQVERPLDDALRRGLVSLPQLQWALDAHGRSRHRGTGVLRSLIEARGAAGKRYVPPESELEAHLYKLVESSDLPEAERQFAIWDGTKDRRLDLAFVRQRLAVEVDGYWSHSDRAAWQDDRNRDNALMGRGWRTLRFTWDDLVGRPDGVLAAIRDSLFQNEP